MALNVISNFAANVAHRNLVVSDESSTNSLSKLSAGKRVLAARDDAASLAIGSRLRAEVSAMMQSRQNASQAASMLQIADGALATVADILVRLKTLAVQSSSGQFSSVERGVLDSEYQALLSEITRISDDTEFNGTQLIAGGSAVFDANGDSVAGDQTLVATTGELTAGSAPGFSVTYDSSKLTTEDTFRISYANATEELSVTNTRSGDRQTIDITTAFNAQLTTNGQNTTANSLNAGTTVNVDFSNLGVTLALDSTFTRNNATINTEGAQAVTVGANAAAVTSTVTYNASGFSNVALGLQGLVALDAGTSYSLTTGILNIVTAHNNGANTSTIAATAGLEFSLDGGAFGATTGDMEDAAIHTVAIRLTGGQTLGTITVDTITSSGTGAGALTLDVGELLFGTAFTSSGTTTSFNFKVGTGTSSQDDLSFTINAASATALSLAGGDINTVATSNTASSAISTAIDTINQQRATIGASQNRLSFASQNLASAIENSEAARSSLLDLDVAFEMAQFTSKQILVQTGISMLAQANQVPQNLLRLFQ